MTKGWNVQQCHKGCATILVALRFRRGSLAPHNCCAPFYVHPKTETRGEMREHSLPIQIAAAAWRRSG